MENYIFDKNYIEEQFKYTRAYNHIDWSYYGKETYEKKVSRLAKIYPAVAEAKAHLDTLVAMVEHGE